MSHLPKDLFAVAGPRTCATCRTGPPQQPRSIVLVPKAAIDAWLLELHALPRRKRATWKHKLLDARGVASKLRYNPKGDHQLPWCSYFEEYNAHASQWLPVYPYEAVRDSFVSLTLVNPLAERTDRIMREGDIEGLRELYTARSSGRPRRNRWVPVPTPTGEPTRG